MSTLVVLGGADGAITTLRAAAALGLRTICVDMRTDAPAAADADELLNISTRDVDAVVAVLRVRTDVAGVVSPASDVNLPSQFEIANRLGLPCGLSAQAVRASVDKGFFRAECDALGLPGPRYVQGRPELVLADAGALGYPLMIKPTDSSGSRGISRVDEPAGLAYAVQCALRFSSSGVVIAEQYLVAEHYTLEAVVVDQRVALLGVSERTLTPPPHFVTTQHVMTTAQSAVQHELRTALDALCARLGYRWGSLNADVMKTRDGAVIVGEWGARLGGNGVAELLDLSTGVDATSAYVATAIGAGADLTASRCTVSASRILEASRAGKLVAVSGVERARQLPGVADIVLAVSPGETVAPYTQAGRKLGYVLTSGADRSAALRACDEVERTLRFTVEPAQQD